ncbi:hypothetical protein [Aeromonas tecta]|uniref:hypothetical protein n=1 Tax=Aeromonas tecta TaxID=324617 RepID=UPI00068230CA|nr:hypothetical protein [Aeromonas tecta]
MNHHFLYGLLWWSVLLPTALLSPIFLLLGLAALMGMGSEGGAISLLLGTSILLGGLGLLTLSRLDRHFRLGAPLGHIRWSLAGLLAGAIASLSLLWLLPGQWFSLWPLLAVAYFLVRLLRR